MSSAPGTAYAVLILAIAEAITSVVTETPQGAPVSGWITITAPAELQIYENQKLLGSSRTDRIMVAAGRHEVELSNDALGYHSAQTIQVSPGQVAKLRPDWPHWKINSNDPDQDAFSRQLCGRRKRFAGILPAKRWSGAELDDRQGDVHRAASLFSRQDSHQVFADRGCRECFGD